MAGRGTQPIRYGSTGQGEIQGEVVISDTSSTTGPAVAASSAAPATIDTRGKRRRIRRIVVVSVTALLAIVCGAMISTYVVAEQLAASVHRIQGVFPKGGTVAGPAALTAAQGNKTIPLTGSDSVAAPPARTRAG